MTCRGLFVFVGLDLGTPCSVRVFDVRFVLYVCCLVECLSFFR